MPHRLAEPDNLFGLLQISFDIEHIVGDLHKHPVVYFSDAFASSIKDLEPVEK